LKVVVMIFTSIAVTALAIYCLAACQDLFRRRISNWLSVGLLVLGVGRWVSAGDPGGGLWALLAAAVGFGVMGALFVRGYLGGGDVKLLASSLFLIGAGAALQMLLLMSVIGGVVSVVVIVVDKAKRRSQPQCPTPTVPYGIAISAAAAWVMCVQLL
jgi:prepilin peptidase CpaA